MMKNKVNFVMKRIGNKIAIKHPEILHFIVTYRCNSRCTFCNIWKMNKGNELTLKEIKNIFSDNIISRIGHVSLTGGEPFLREDLTDIIRFLVDRGKTVSINTNGLMTHLILRKLNEILDIKDKISLGVSVDGRKNTHNKLRGIKNGYQKTIKTIEGIKKLGYHCSISFTIGPQNYNDLPFVYELSKKYNLGFAMRPVQISIYYHNVGKDFIFKKNEIKKIKKYIDKILFDQRNKFNNFYDPNLVFYDNIIKYIEGNPLKIRCFALKKFLFIDPYGYVLPCPNVKSNFNIRYSSFSKLWNSKGLKEMQDRISNLKYCDYCWNDCAIGSNLTEEIFLTMKNTRKTKNRLKGGNYS